MSFGKRIMYNVDAYYCTFCNVFINTNIGNGRRLPQIKYRIFKL